MQWLAKANSQYKSCWGLIQLLDWFPWHNFSLLLIDQIIWLVHLLCYEWSPTFQSPIFKFINGACDTSFSTIDCLATSSSHVHYHQPQRVSKCLIPNLHLKNIVHAISLLPLGMLLVYFLFLNLNNIMMHVDLHLINLWYVSWNVLYFKLICHLVLYIRWMMVDLNPGPFVVQGVIVVSHHPCEVNHWLWLKSLAKKKEEKPHKQTHNTRRLM